MMSNNDVCAGCGRRLGIVQHARDGKWFCLECIDNPPKVIQRSELSSKEKLLEEEVVDQLCQDTISNIADIVANTTAVDKLEAEVIGLREHISHILETLAKLNEMIMTDEKEISRTKMQLNHTYIDNVNSLAELNHEDIDDLKLVSISLKKALPSVKARLTKLEKK